MTVNSPTHVDTISSTPALAAALRVTGQSRIQAPELADLHVRALVPMYRLQAQTVEQEIDHAVQVVEETAERLRRLATAYGEWRMFDASAYFDLTPAQAATLVTVVERVRSVHVRFFIDLLLPSFQQAVTCWQTDYSLTYAGMRQQVRAGLPSANGNGILNGNVAFVRSAQPRMVAHWNRVLAVVDGVHRRLADDITLWTMSGSEEERSRWRHYWRLRPEVGVEPALLPALASLRTLTLTYDFPLPVNRQPERLRRLRHSRQRRERRHLRRRSS